MRKERGDISPLRKKMSLAPGLKKKIEDQGLSPRWVNDWPGRIEELHELGYAFVQKDGQCSFENHDLTSHEGDGSLIRRAVGTHEDGRPMYAYLMAQDAEILEEDRAESRSPLKEQAEILKSGYDPNAPADNRYGGIKVESKLEKPV